MLSPVLLETLRQYWRHCKPKEWLFPGANPGRPIRGNGLHDLSQCRPPRWNQQKALPPFASQGVLVLLIVCIPPRSATAITHVTE